MIWRVSPTRTLALDQPRIIGVLNVTPDSFSDGGQYTSHDDAVSHALQMEAHGACMIDVGGESTRPGSHSVDDEEQVRRTAPVIESIRRRSEVLISIDTTRSMVAAAALDAGADVINDISAGRGDARDVRDSRGEAMFTLAAARGCGLILMHRLVRPADDSYSHEYRQAPVYDDVVTAVGAFLRERAAAAEAVGVDRQSIVLDPGHGFGKSVEQNYELIARSGELAAIGYPIVSAASRKSFIGKVTGVERPADRVAGSVAISVLHWLGGVRLFRVHDVAAHAQALAVMAARDACAGSIRPA